MSLNRLKTFLEVYRQGSMGKAANALGISQPAVSQQVQVLEHQFGRPLFERLKRGIKPTAAADDLAKNIAVQIDDLEQTLSERLVYSQNISGIIHIGTPAEYFSSCYTSMVKPLVEKGLQVRISLGGREQLYQMLDADQLDLMIIASKPDARILASTKLGVEQLILVGSIRLAKHFGSEPVTLEALEQFPCVAYDTELPLIREYTKQVFGRMATLKPVVTAPDLRSVAGLCTALDAWSVLPDYLIENQLITGQLLPLLPDVIAPVNSFFLAWKRMAIRSHRVAFARDTLLQSLR